MVRSWDHRGTKIETRQLLRATQKLHSSQNSTNTPSPPHNTGTVNQAVMFKFLVTSDICKNHKYTGIIVEKFLILSRQSHGYLAFFCVAVKTQQ